MKKVKKFLSFLVFLAGLIAIANVFYPQIGRKIKAFWQNPLIEKQLRKTAKKSEQFLTDILTSKPGVGDSQGEVAGQFTTSLDSFPEEISKEKLIEEVKTKINQLVSNKVEEVKEVPEKQLEEIKKEVKKQIYQEVCQQWLKEE